MELQCWFLCGADSYFVRITTKEKKTNQHQVQRGEFCLIPFFPTLLSAYYVSRQVPENKAQSLLSARGD